MGSRHHYVSQFHLRSFADPAASRVQEPWLWVGDVAGGAIERRSPKNVAWHRDLFAGPGALADREATLEEWLAQNVEGPAAGALRSLVSHPPVTAGLAIPPPLSRYLAWAAARSLPADTARGTRRSATLHDCHRSFADCVAEDLHG